MKVVKSNYALSVINDVGNIISKVLGRKIELEVIEPYNTYTNYYAFKLTDNKDEQDILEHKKEIKELCGDKIVRFIKKREWRNIVYNPAKILLRTIPNQNLSFDDKKRNKEQALLTLEFSGK